MEGRKFLEASVVMSYFAVNTVLFSDHRVKTCIFCFFQVFYILLTFYGPLPGALAIERSADGGNTFQPWQYFAEDCVASFQQQNNGPLSEPDSVNCIQYVKLVNPFP